MRIWETESAINDQVYFGTTGKTIQVFETLSSLQSQGNIVKSLYEQDHNSGKGNSG